MWIVIIAVLSADLTGCGYRPLYGSTGVSSSVAAGLSSISIEQQQGRAGQLVRNELISALGHSSDGSQLFSLKLEPVEKTVATSTVAAQRLVRKRYRLSVKYTLLSAKAGAVASEGTVFSNVSYDTVREPIADLQASDNARDRASREVAEDIRLRLAAFLSSAKG